MGVHGALQRGRSDGLRQGVHWTACCMPPEGHLACSGFACCQQVFAGLAGGSKQRHRRLPTLPACCALKEHSRDVCLCSVAAADPSLTTAAHGLMATGGCLVCTPGMNPLPAWHPPSRTLRLLPWGLNIKCRIQHLNLCSYVTHLVDARVLGHSRACPWAIAGQHVDDARGDACLQCKLSKPQRRQGGLLCHLHTSSQPVMTWAVQAVLLA